MHKWRKENPVEAWIQNSWCSAKYRAAKNGFPFDITKDYLRSILTERCPALGVDLVFSDGHGPRSASLDRIIPSRGYVIGNVAVISRKANAMKSDGTLEEIESLVRWLRSINQLQSP